MNRNLTTKIAYVLDELIPAAIRDSKWFMWIPFRILFGDKSKYFFDFKDRAFDMTDEEFKGTYELLADVHIQRETDLNEPCIAEILRNVTGENLLEVGCGRGYLAEKLTKKITDTTACDMVITDSLRSKYPDIRFQEANIEALPFADNTFDTVISTHTLEHVLDLAKAISELRRVTRKRLIIVVPKQRPYKYTFDLHLHFFPYKHSFLAHMANENRDREIILLDGDWYYQEEHG